jgi:hypothetical protein
MLNPQGLIVPEEKGAMKLVWELTDDWEPYVQAHMEAIRAKYFAPAAEKERKSPVMHQPPPAKLIK